MNLPGIEVRSQGPGPPLSILEMNLHRGKPGGLHETSPVGSAAPGLGNGGEWDSPCPPGFSGLVRHARPSFLLLFYVDFEEPCLLRYISHHSASLHHSSKDVSAFIFFGCTGQHVGSYFPEKRSCSVVSNSLRPLRSPPGFSVHGMFQARVLEWVAISFSKGSSQPRDWTWVSRIAGKCSTVWATREASYTLSVLAQTHLPKFLETSLDKVKER